MAIDADAGTFFLYAGTNMNIRTPPARAGACASPPARHEIRSTPSEADRMSIFRSRDRRAVPAALAATLAVVALFLADPTALHAAPAAPLEFRQGDHICIIGNTLADRMQHDGWLETLPPEPLPQARAGHPQPRLLRRRSRLRQPIQRAPLGRLRQRPTSG